jgi:hypothetical protein
MTDEVIVESNSELVPEIVPEQEEQEAAEEVPEGTPEAEEVAESQEEPEGEEAKPVDAYAAAGGDLPEFKSRFGRLQKQHQREIRTLNQKLDAVLQQRQIGYQPPVQQTDIPFVDPMTGAPIEEGSIEHVVLKTLAAKERKEQEGEAVKRQQLQEQQKNASLQRHRNELQKELDRGSDVYPDFDDVVRHEDAPITEIIRDAAMFVPNAADVFNLICKDDYKELNRINGLDPIEQFKEMARIGMQLAQKKAIPSKAPNPLKKLSSNPGAAERSSSQLNENSPMTDFIKAVKTWRK